MKRKTITQPFGKTIADKKAKSDFRKFLLALALLGASISAKAQFIYPEAIVSYEFSPYDSYQSYPISHQTFKLNLGVMYRPLRHLSLGLSFGIPLSQNTTYRSLHYSSDGGSSFGGFTSTYYESAERYFPQELDYNFDYHTTVQFKFRILVYQVQGLYFDFRLAYQGIDENFVFKRDALPAVYSGSDNHLQYGAVEMENINISRKHALLIPGGSMGFLIKLSTRLKLDINFTLDFFSYKKDPMVVNMSYNWDGDETEYGYINGLTSQPRVVIGTGFGFNYCF